MIYREIYNCNTYDFITNFKLNNLSEYNDYNMI